MGITISKTKLLLVEGGHEVQFFKKLLDSMRIDNIQVEQVGSNYFRPTLKGIRKVSNFSSVQSMGVIRDADNDFNATFASIQDTLRNLEFSSPRQPLESVGNNPSVIVFICPDNNSPGSLEDLCLLSVESDPVSNCVTQYMNCVEDVQGIEHPHKSAAMVQVFLAKEPDGDIHMGIAAKRDIWQWNNPAFDQIKDSTEKRVGQNQSKIDPPQKGKSII